MQTAQSKNARSPAVYACSPAHRNSCRGLGGAHCKELCSVPLALPIACILDKVFDLVVLDLDLLEEGTGIDELQA